MAAFAATVVAWQAQHGRRGLPWQASRDPYRVWLSEIMLQQTQVATVVPYYERFVARFPDVRALAAVPVESVMALWAGLGYYSRARNLHRCARMVVDDLGGTFPRTAAQLAELPGIGRSTAAAIAAFCANERVAILDGNVKRVLARYLGIDGDPAAAAVERTLWQHANGLLPPDACAMPAYTQAVMDLGATVCVRRAPRCDACPLRRGCVARREDRVGELPTRRRRRAPPLRQAHLLVALHDGAVLVERRPPAGIWGGLLALPQFDDAVSLQQWLTLLAKPLPGLPVAAQAWPARRHMFTHFTLQFTPHLAQVAHLAPSAMEPRWSWLALGEVATAALPAPLRVLLSEVGQTLEAGLAGAT